MPHFELVSLQEARLKTASGRQGQALRDYAPFIQRLKNGEAGKLTVGRDEKVTTIRRRLITTANLLGVNLTIRRSGDELYFWVEPAGEERPKRGRRRRNKQDAGTASA